MGIKAFVLDTFHVFYESGCAIFGGVVCLRLPFSAFSMSVISIYDHLSPGLAPSADIAPTTWPILPS